MLALGLAFAVLPPAAAPAFAAPAAKPLFRDPVFDGAADPVVVWNPAARKWWMFYTNRRANQPGLSGVAWVHGCRIGIAESADGGATWTYAGTAHIELPPEIGGTEPTHWAPHIVTAAEVRLAARPTLDGLSRQSSDRVEAELSRRNAAGAGADLSRRSSGGKADPSSRNSAEAEAETHHMYLTVVPGIFENWQHPRRIVHLTSTNLRDWKYRSALSLASDRVIDAAVFPLPGGGWRMWYNNERDRKSIYFADSPDLFTWTERGKASGVGERPGEGPYVFHWKNSYWMVVDLWRGLGVYRSDDLLQWTAQPTDLLGVPGQGPDAGVNGGHPGVVISGDRAYLFYFTHPGRNGTISPDDKDNLELRRSSIHVVELFLRNGQLTCNRDTVTDIALPAP